MNPDLPIFLMYELFLNHIRVPIGTLEGLGTSTAGHSSVLVQSQGPEFLGFKNPHPRGPRGLLVYTLAPKYPCKEYLKADVSYSGTWTLRENACSNFLGRRANLSLGLEGWMPLKGLGCRVFDLARR